ncbi:MAG: hypothetical protein GWN14_21430, partial [candidate division Zixibacteria bacterium]|nr:hypothetical protein [candidate division Zixibacteria bacterium]
LTAEKALKMSPRELALADWAVTKALREFEETAVRDTLLRMPEHMGKSYDELIKLGVFKKRILPESITETKFQAMRRFISERSLYANVQDIYLDAVRRLVPEDQWENFAPKAQQTQEIIRALRGSGGAVSFLEDGSALMHIVKGAEYDTAIHEIGHVFRNSLDDLQLKRLEGIVGLDEGEFKSLRPTFEEYRTLKNKKRLNKAQKARMDEIEADALRYEAAEERFADDFTTYLRNGEAPVQELKTLFEKFKRWLQEIFSKLRNNADLKLTDSMK